MRRHEWPVIEPEPHCEQKGQRCSVRKGKRNSVDGVARIGRCVRRDCDCKANAKNCMKMVDKGDSPAWRVFEERARNRNKVTRTCRPDTAARFTRAHLCVTCCLQRARSYAACFRRSSRRRRCVPSLFPPFANRCRLDALSSLICKARNTLLAGSLADVPECRRSREASRMCAASFGGYPLLCRRYRPVC